MKITFVSLERWPGQPTPSVRRRRSQFASSWSNTVDLLERELEAIRAKNVVIQADCDRSELRLDGQLRSNAKLRGPGIVLSFETPKGALSFPCDTFSFPCDTFTEWQANVRGIALSLEALRSVDRYGVTRNSEQYKGWNALPDNRQEQKSKRQAAAEWMVQAFWGCFGNTEPSPTVQQLLEDESIRKSCRAKLLTAYHPDRCSDPSLFRELQEHLAAFDN